VNGEAKQCDALICPDCQAELEEEYGQGFCKACKQWISRCNQELFGLHRPAPGRENPAPGFAVWKGGHTRAVAQWYFGTEEYPKLCSTHAKQSRADAVEATWRISDELVARRGKA
jgi:hypothetical protein